MEPGRGTQGAAPCILLLLLQKKLTMNNGAGSGDPGCSTLYTTAVAAVEVDDE